jgi:hypothetical protein
MKLLTIFIGGTIMERTLEQRVAFLEESMVKQNEIAINRGEALITLINNQTDIYKFIDKMDKDLIDLINQQTECIIKLDKRIKQLEQKVK